MRYNRMSVPGLLAIMAGLLSTPALAQEAERLIGSASGIILLMANNPLATLAIFLAAVLFLGKSLDLFRSLRARRMATDGELPADAEGEPE